MPIPGPIQEWTLLRLKQTPPGRERDTRASLAQLFFITA